MQHLDKYVEMADDFAKKIPELVKVCNKHGIKPGHVLLGGGTFFALLMVLLQGYNIICVLLTCIYPMYASIKAIETEESDDDKKWLCFWCIFGIFQTIEMFFGFFLSYVPYYMFIRLGFFIFLMAP